MKLLLDTCTFLWIITDAPDLSARARDLFLNPDHEVYLSSVSVWEMCVKYKLGRLPFPEPPERFIPLQRERHAIESLPLTEPATLHLHKLSPHHQDPFDRMLVCQAVEHEMVLLTPDPLITQYPIRTAW
ncbi:MAG: type II toxin-antitoxin system VapC family toxin [Nitrospirae bacterium]|nr:type II toxin-antitoxin system VapC family toxin [Nitrospirota bacterium]